MCEVQIRVGESWARPTLYRSIESAVRAAREAHRSGGVARVIDRRDNLVVWQSREVRS
jgi:hypothetical protein